MSRPSRTGIVPAIKDAPREDKIGAGAAGLGFMFGGVVVLLLLIHELKHDGPPSIGELVLWGVLAVVAALLLTGERISKLGGILKAARTLRE